MMVSFLDLPPEIRLMIYKEIEPTLKEEDQKVNEDIIVNDHDRVIILPSDHGRARYPAWGAETRFRLAHTCHTMRSDMRYPFGLKPGDNSKWDSDPDWLLHVMVGTSMMWYNPRPGRDWKELRCKDYRSWFREVTHIRLPEHLLENLCPRDVGFADRILEIMKALGLKDRIDFVTPRHDDYWKLFHKCSITQFGVSRYPRHFPRLSLSNKNNLIEMENDLNLNESIELPMLWVQTSCGQTDRKFLAGNVTVKLYY